MNYESIKFINFDDFYKSRKTIRYTYRKLLLRDKIAFKHYVYYELKDCELDKDIIWNFLNENEYCKRELINRIKYKRRINRKD